jgi:hypothetical protein
VGVREAGEDAGGQDVGGAGGRGGAGGAGHGTPGFGDVNLPSSYAAVWKLMCDMEARDFADEGLRMLFHAHLMHDRFLSSQVHANVSTPGWLTVEARDVWMREVRNHTTVSRSHQELAQTFDELGVRHKVEHVT